MKKSYCLFFFVVLISFSYSKAGANEPIIWLQPDFPPYIISEKLDKAKGIDNRIADFIMQHLPEYHHLAEKVSYNSALIRLKDQQSVIITPLFKTPEREKYVLYSSVASYLVLPNGLIIKKKHKEKFIPYLSKKGTLDIDAVMASKKFIIGINAGRSYSGIIDETIKKYKNSGLLVERDGSDLSCGIIRMLYRDRIDAVFGFPVEAKYVSKKLGLPKDLFEILPISKMVSYIPVYFGVPKNEWGKNVISKIDSLLKDEKNIQTFINFYEYWLDNAGIQRYKKILKKYYDSNTHLVLKNN